MYSRVCVEITNLCNMSCSFCHGHHRSPRQMSDYEFDDERHFFPGYGKINWNELITALENVDYNGPFLYEGGFEPSSWDPTVPYGTIGFIALFPSVALRQLPPGGSLF